MKKIILNGPTDEIHIKDVDVNKPIFVKENGKLIGIVAIGSASPHCGIYHGYGTPCFNFHNLYDLIQCYLKHGSYTFHVED